MSPNRSALLNPPPTGTVHLPPLANQLAVMFGEELIAHPSPRWWLTTGFKGSWFIRSLAGPPRDDQILLATAPNTKGPSPLNMNAGEGPEPHLSTPTAELIAG